MTKLSIRDLDLDGQRVFIRVDFNVPLKDGVIGDDTRIRASLPTIKYALEHGRDRHPRVSHLGRPKGKPNPELSLRPVADALAELLGRPVAFADDCIGDAGDAARSTRRTPSGGVVLLENLRFHPEEEKNDPAFAEALASLADVYVNDAFGAAHRAHASVEGITHHVPQAAAGLLMEQELQYLGHALESPERPFVAILGGAKVSDKIEVIENLLGKVDRAAHRRRDGLHVLQGARRAGRQVARRGRQARRGARRSRPTPTARGRAARAAGRSRRAPTASRPARRTKCSRSATRAIGDRMGLDIGPATIAAYAALIADAKTVVWNGPMGVFEIDAFAAGTNAVAQAVADVKGTTIIGGGDSIAAVKKAGRRRSHHAHLDRRRRVARVPRRPDAAGRRRAHGQIAA